MKGLVYFLVLGFVGSVLVFSKVDGYRDFRVVEHEELLSSSVIFNPKVIKSYGQILLDHKHNQLIVGSKNYLLRLSKTRKLNILEIIYLPADQTAIEACKVNHKEYCENYIEIVVKHGDDLFTCGTNAFMPKCSVLSITSLKRVKEEVDGLARCPNDPTHNFTALMTSEGQYFIASKLGPDSKDSSITRFGEMRNYLRTMPFNSQWLNQPEFVASFEIQEFVYFFFREIALDYVGDDVAIYSRIARVCKNDSGGKKYPLRNRWTTFLKVRLVCYLDGRTQFYFDEIESVYYSEREQLFFATFNTNDNSIHGSAICVYNMSAIDNAFSGPFKYQTGDSKNAWGKSERDDISYFNCKTERNDSDFIVSQHYHLMFNPVYPNTTEPLYTGKLERLGHLVVDYVVLQNGSTLQVIFVMTGKGLLQKLIVLNNTACLVEEIHLFPKYSSNRIKTVKLCKHDKILYIGTEQNLMRISVERCHRLKSLNECLHSGDPYCGWNLKKKACTSLPKEIVTDESDWIRGKLACPEISQWSEWSLWSECSVTCGISSIRTRHRSCDKSNSLYPICAGSTLEVQYCENIPICSTFKYPEDLVVETIPEEEISPNIHHVGSFILGISIILLFAVFAKCYSMRKQSRAILTSFRTLRNN